MRDIVLGTIFVLAACGSDGTPPLATAQPGVVFTFPLDGQLDVPIGARLVIAFSDPIEANMVSGVVLAGPAGPVTAMPQLGSDQKTVSITAALDAGTTYTLSVAPNVAPFANNLPMGPLVTFTTRSDRPRAAPPTLVAVNGADPGHPDAFRPMFDTSTIRLVFSEPLDPRSVALAPGSVELVDPGGALVPSTVIASGIHVAIDPIKDLTGGATYVLRLGGSIVDLGGQPLAPKQIMLAVKDTRGALGPIAQTLRTRVAGDPGATDSRSGAQPNAIALSSPLIGAKTETLLASTLAAELGDPKVLGGPIAFVLRRGQRMRATGLDVALGGAIPAGLSTGETEIVLLTDAGGRLYRNPHQSPDQRPENARAPLYVDLSLDLAVYAMDPKGNAVLAQTILGVQATGTAIATQGVLDIESVAAMELGLLGVAKAPTNFVLELITDTTASPPPPDRDPLVVVATFPAMASAELPVDAGIELIFNKPIDLDRARAGGLQLQTSAGTAIPAAIESHGSAVVIRPLARLAYSSSYRVVPSDVADLAGNTLADKSPIPFSTPKLVATSVPLAVSAVHPGAPCALTSGRCTGGANNDDTYHPFALAADQPIEVAFTQPLAASSVVRGSACNAGTVRVEEVAGDGSCAAPVAGTLLVRDRSLAFVPDAPWTASKRYRLTLVSGANRTCDAGDLCGLASAASFDPLNGATNSSAGGPNLVIDFAGAPADGSTYMVTTTAPFTDINGSGFLENPEVPQDGNRAALRITGTTGAVSSAHFNDADCIPSTPETEACLYLSGAMPVAMQALQMNCMLPDGTTAASCIPVEITPGAMYATSVSMTATVVIGITTDTGTSVMRIREPSGPVIGYIVDRNGPTLVASLDLYMDAPDMSLPLGTTHDLHSKPLTIGLAGPVTFLDDGRIAIGASNVADVPVTVNIDAPLGVSGAVQMIVPQGEMKLQLVSPPLRGAPW